MRLSIFFVGQALRLPKERWRQPERLPCNPSSSGMMRRSVAPKGSNSRAAFYEAMLQWRRSSKSPAYGLRSILLHGQKTGFISIKKQITKLSRTTRRVPCSRLFCGRRRVRAHVRPRRRGRRCGRGRKFGNIAAGNETRAERLKGALDRAGRFSNSCAPPKSGRAYDLIILDPPSFTKTKSGLRDAFARLPRTSHARVQIVIERWIARDIFVLASRQRSGFLTNDRGRAGRCAPLGEKTPAVRASDRSSGSPHHSRNRILQRNPARNDARPVGTDAS